MVFDNYISVLFQEVNNQCGPDCSLPNKQAPFVREMEVV